MPRNSHAVRTAIWAPRDLRRPVGTELFHRGDDETAVTADTWAGRTGLFRTPVAATCGHGSHASLAADVDLAWQSLGGGAGELVFGLDPDTDRWFITNNSPELAALAAHADHVIWGFGADELPIPIGGTVTASADWRRGMVTNGEAAAPPRLHILRDGIVGTGYAPESPGWITDVIVAARERLGLGDLDDDAQAGDPAESTSIEALDLATYGASSGIRWGHTDDGHIYWTQPVDAGGPEVGNPITWVSDWFRQAVGASGNEAVGQTGVGAGHVYFQIFDYPDPSLAITEWPVEYDELGFETDQRRTVTTGSGATTVRAWRTDVIHSLRFRIDGPVDRKDWHQHYIRRLLPRLAGRQPLWIVQDWGDSRRAIERGTYTLLYTPEREGYRGRYALQLRGDIDSRIQWDGGLMSSAVITLTGYEG